MLRKMNIHIQPNIFATCVLTSSLPEINSSNKHTTGRDLLGFAVPEYVKNGCYCCIEVGWGG